MSISNFSSLVSRHRNYFRSGATRPVEWREGQLTALRSMMTDHADDFYAALWSDLRRNLLRLTVLQLPPQPTAGLPTPGCQR